MKKSLITLLIIMVSIAMNAERVSKQEALQKAQEFMPNKQFGEAKAFARGESASLAEYEAFYIFNAEGKKGFVIVSGDDRTEPILGYSDRGCLNIDSVPDNVKWLLGYYEKALTAIANDKSYTRPAKTRGGERATVEPLLTTKWNQGFPYNLKCPFIDENRCVTGCVATAMAQVMNYHQWPKEETTLIPEYFSEMNQILMPELKPTKFGWGYLGARELGTLMLYCGQSVQMEYGVNGSGAFVELVPFALQNYFGYKDNIQYVLKENYSDDDWEETIYKEMVHNRPVIYNGYGSENSGDIGHAFVIDGYKSGHFHINWGWGGLYNGDFILTGLNPGVDSYNESQGAVIGIQSPEESRIIIHPNATVVNALHEGSKYLWRQSDGSFPSFKLSFQIETMSYKNETLQLGFALCDKNGIIKVYAQETQEIPPGSFFLHNADISIDETIADGDYSILPVSRKSDTEPWSVDESDVYRMGVQPDFFTELSINKDLLNLYVENYWPTCSIYDREYCGYTVENGITYHLWEEHGKYRATVVPKKYDGYSGNIYIPDAVIFNDKKYLVYDADDYAFTNCPNLISLSTAMFEGPQVVNCPKLTNLELREGIKYYIGSINGCATLKEISFPKSIDVLFRTPFNCESLKSISFLNPYLFYINTRPTWSNDVLPSLTDIYFSSQYPPYIFWIEDGFPVNTNTTIHIPQGSISAYKNSSWKDWNLSDDNNDVIPNQICWGYCIENEQTDFKTDLWGQIVETAIRVPSDMIMPYINKKITGIQFCSSGCAETWPDYVFVAKPGTTDYLSKQLAGKNYNMGGWCTIALKEPCLITGEELFVGLGRKDLLGVHVSSTDIVEKESFWKREYGTGSNMDGKWLNIAENEPTFAHPLTIRFIIEGEDFPKDVRMCYPHLDDNDTPKQLLATVVNRCTNVMESYVVNWVFDGKINGSKTINTRLASGLSETLSIDIPSDLNGYHHTMIIDIIKVNGENDAIPANSHLVYEFTTPGKQYPRTMVMENFVATWNGWSPRAYSANEKMYEKYPDNFISIGIHEEDDLGEPINYDTYLKTYTSIPTFLFNRVKTIDTTLDNAISAMEDMNAADAMISANAVFATEDKTSVTVKTATTFGFTEEGNADFRIAYVVVEDNVGPIMQYNFYSDPTKPDDPNDYMNEWFKKGSPVEMKFNDVARGIYGGLNGTEGSVPTSVVAGQPYEYEYTFELPDNIQDKKNIRIVTLLIDNKSGEIMNADQTKVITETDKDGDANNDNEVDDKDVEAVVRYIMYGDIKGFNAKNAHGSDKGNVTVADIVRILNMIKETKQ